MDAIWILLASYARGLRIKGNVVYGSLFTLDVWLNTAFTSRFTVTSSRWPPRKGNKVYCLLIKRLRMEEKKSTNRNINIMCVRVRLCPPSSVPPALCVSSVVGCPSYSLGLLLQTWCAAPSKCTACQQMAAYIKNAWRLNGSIEYGDFLPGQSPGPVCRSLVTHLFPSQNGGVKTKRCTSETALKTSCQHIDGQFSQFHVNVLCFIQIHSC